jgi:hypothetical protein
MPTRRTFFSAIALSAAALWPRSTFARQRRRRRRVARPAPPPTNVEPITRGSFPTGYYYRDRDIEFVVPDLTKWSKLGIGMTSADVRRLLGPPLDDGSGEDPEFRHRMEIDLPDNPNLTENDDADDLADRTYRQTRYRWNETWCYGHFKYLTNDLYADFFAVAFLEDRLHNVYDPFGEPAYNSLFGGDITDFGIPHSQHLSYDGRPTVPRLLTPTPDAKLTHAPFILDFRWLPVCGEYPIEYELEMTCGNDIYHDEIGGTKREWYVDIRFIEHTKATHIATLAQGSNPHRWRVRAKNRLGTSEWSEYRYFQFD